MATQADAFIQREIAPHLEPGEEILAAAYLYPELTARRWGAFAEAASKMAAFAVLTPSRLHLIQTRIGAFAPLLENHGIRSFDRSTLRGVCVLGGRLHLELGDGSILTYRCNASTSAVSTHAELLARVDDVFGESQRARDEAQSARTERWGGIVIGVVLALAALAYGYYSKR